MDGRSKIPYLPTDIVNSIFLELPPKSLSRFKSCCKSWHCCIDDADFIKSHLHKSSVDISRQKTILVNFIASMRTATHKFEVVSTEASINVNSKVVHLNVPEFFNNYFCLEVFSCSGLILMASHNPGYRMTLWNPAVGKYKLIPNSPLTQTKISSSITSPIFGFAYDFVAEDYKIICVQYLIKDYFNVVEVYSVKNQCWRRIHNIFPVSYPNLYNNQVSLNGVIHRISHNSNRAEYAINTFHLVDEKFTVTIVPSTCGKQPTLHALGDRVCVLATVGEEIFIWSLEKRVWNCINKFPTLLSLIGRPIVWSLEKDLKDYPVGTFLLVKENGNILWRKHDDSFIEYDMRKNEYIEFKSTQVPHFGPNKALYVESLVSLKIPWD